MSEAQQVMLEPRSRSVVDLHDQGAAPSGDAPTRPKRRLVILGKYFPGAQAGAKSGGIETDTLAVAEALKDEFDVTVLAHSTTATGSKEQWPGFKVVRTGTQAVLFSQPISLAHFVWLRRLKPDLIQLHAPNHWASLSLRLSGSKAPVIVTHHMEVQGRRWVQALVAPIYRAVCRAARVVIVSTPSNLTYSADLPNPLAHVEVIPYGLDPADYAVDAAVKRAARELRDALGLTGPVAGFVGRAVPYKGLPILIEALSLRPGIGCIVVGDGPLLDGLKAEVEVRGMTDRVKFLGRLADERAKLVALAAMDWFVLPSISPAEAFAIVQVEAQLCGLPVINSRLPTGVSDVTVDGETGLHFTAGDAGDLAEKMDQLVRDPERAIAMGQAGRARALAYYTAGRHRDEIVRVFRSAGSA